MTYLRRHILALGVLFAGVLMAMPQSASASVRPHDGLQNMSFSQPASLKTVTHKQYAQTAISASKAKAIARREVPGSAYVDMSRKGNVYKVRVKKDGRIIDVLIDASTGRVLN